jgi:hypothetical protein
MIEMKFSNIWFILLAVVSTGWAGVILEENFESGVFPPTGWTRYPDPFYSPTWCLFEYQGNHYTNCLSISQYETEAYLRTLAIQMNAGQTVTINFDSEISTSMWFYPTVDLLQGSKIIYTFYPNRRKPFHYCYITPPISVSSTYYVQWRLVQFAPSGCSYSVDNIVINVNDAKNGNIIQPTSLGSIKAAYR